LKRKQKNKKESYDQSIIFTSNKKKKLPFASLRKDSQDEQ
jgi:hypothetical protein